ncbi:MAG: beta-ketoacyl synthase N-terminal-like domain-containing protein [Byssovorax sp.]
MDDQGEAGGREDPGESERPEAIAIIGVGLRVPGADDPETFWRNLAAGVESVRGLSDEELDRAGVPASIYRDPRYVRERGRLGDVGLFDPTFFGMSPREAAMTDPQHRLFLMCAEEALERAGQDPSRHEATFGVFGGVSPPGYLVHHVLPRQPMGDIVADLPALIGNDKDHLATRVAYKLDLRGPCMTIQSACSTGLVAVHAACRSLLAYECDVALAGAASIHFPQGTGYLFQEGNIASPDGHCRAFDEKAAGAVGGDGAAVVVLKRLSEAIAAGDPIHAVIRGIASNNDGSQKVGYTAPSLDGQAEVIALCHALAEIEPASVGYVEAHGTGTPLGDPIEIAALHRAFGSKGPCPRESVAIGSLKSNLGHLDTAAGIAGLVKATLAVEHGQVPPSLHVERPSPALGLDAGPFYVSRALHPFPARSGPRRAGVSSFGIGGTNAHAVLEEAPAVPSGPARRETQILTVSARSPEALDTACQRLADHLAARPDLALADVAHTLQQRRAFSHRRAFTAGDLPGAIEALRAPGEATRAIAEPQVVFLFPGQGAPQAGVARALYDREPVFRARYDRASLVLKPTLGIDLRSRLDDGAIDDDPALLQPALFTLQWSLAELWTSFGLRPAALLGHSLGEYVAACVAGVFSLEDALALVSARARLVAKIPRGAMLAVPLGAREVEALLASLRDRSLGLAAENGPSASVIAGPIEAIDALAARLDREGTRATRLRTTHAFHAPMMDPILDAFRDELRRISLAPPKIPYLSNVTGTWVGETEATDPEHWVRHLRGTVRFSPAIRELGREPGRILLEVGPGRTLSALAAQHRGEGPAPVLVASMPSATSDGDPLAEAAGKLWAAGAPVDFKARDEGQRRKVPLPPTPFDLERCWIDRPVRAARAALPPLDDAEAKIREALAIRPLEGYPGLEAALDAYCAGKLIAWLDGQGVAVRPGERHGTDALARRLRIVPSLRRLFDAFLAILIEDGWARIDGDDLVFGELAAARPDLPALRRDLDARYPALRGIYDLVDHAAAHYPEALTGEVPAISVLYPGGSPRLVEQSEQDTVEHRSERIYITLLVEAVVTMVASSPKRLRILEIGGGRGTLTWPLVAALAGRADYHFTDLGRVFVDDAGNEARARGLDGAMRFSVLDIGERPEPQGVAPGSYDLVVAFNVVHAARSVPAALRNLGALLAPGGAIGLVEVVRTRRWDTLTWGLAEGWWHYDDALRTSSPLLDLATWERALREAGFADAVAYPRDPGERSRQDHGLVLGRSAEMMAAPLPAPAPVEARPRPARASAFIGPRDTIEEKVAAVCAELLGVAQVGARDDLYELGADSLLMLRIMDRLRRDPSLTVPASAAFRGATVEKIAAALGGAEAQASAPDESSPLVPLQTSGARPPLFFVHPAAGVVFPYVELSRLLGQDQPFYGLQALGLDGLTAPDQTIADMARRYVEAMRSVQPRGPYFLGGFSFGCLVAFEMAQELARAGDEVALLAMVDEPAPVHGHRPSALVMGKLLATGIARSIWPYLHDYFYLKSGPKDEAPAGPPWLSQRMSGEWLSQFLAMSTMANFVPREHRIVALRQPAMVPMFELFLLHLRETMAYMPKAYPGKLTLFRATRLGGRFAKDPTMGWGLLAAGGVTVLDIPGEHLTVLRQPHVEALARLLRRCLDDAQQGRDR